MMQRSGLVWVVCALAIATLSQSVASQAAPKFRHLAGGYIEGVHFLDESHGWTAEDGCRIRVTDDGGVTWEYADTDDESPGSWVRMRGLFCMEVDNEIIAWACGDNGVVLTSTDGEGLIWEDINPTSRVTSRLDVDDDCGEHLAKLYDIFMLDEDNGWVVGEDAAISVTDDGGETWTSVSIPTYAAVGCGTDPHDFYDIHLFEDPGEEDHYLKGIIASEYRTVYVTDDGGDTWSVIDVTQDAEDAACPTIPSGHNRPENNLEFWKMDFLDPLDSTSAGFIAGGINTNQAHIYWTSNGGQEDSWTQSYCYDFLDPEHQISPPLHGGPSTAYGLAVLDPTTGLWIATGYAGEVYALEAGTANVDMCVPELATPSECVSALVWVQKSTQLLPPGPVLSDKTLMRAVSRITSGTAAIVGNWGRILLFDADAVYEADVIVDVANIHFNRLNDGAFVSASTGWIAGQGNVVLATTDGGQSWAVEDVPWSLDGGGQAFGIALSSSASERVVVGLAGFIGWWDGDEWLEVASEDKPEDLGKLTAVAYAGSSTFYAVGGGGKVIKSTDSGETWSEMTAAGEKDLLGVSFASASTGYVVGMNQNVHMTGNGGTSWTAVPVTGGMGESFHDVQTWDDGTEAILVSQFGGVFEKTDTRFIKQDLGSAAVSAHLNDVEVLSDGDVVRICGENGTVLFRDSGTWTRVRSQTNDPLWKLSFDAADHGFGIGQSFVIVEYTD